MTQKDKAKRYDEALERAKKEWSNNLDNAYKNYRERLEIIFPELKESEDEKICEQIISFIEEYGNPVHCEWQKEWVAWLEKQGDKDKLIKELGKYKVKYTQEVLEKHINSMSNKDDERLRKTTIAFLKDFADKGYENAVECIDWLEKQKSIDILDEEERAFADNVDAWREKMDKSYQDGYNEAKKQVLKLITNL